MSSPEHAEEPRHSRPTVKQERILDVLYDTFERWCLSSTFHCSAGCATCCTRDVTITALEGKRILDYCRANGDTSFLADRLNVLSPGTVPRQTTNEYVADVLRQGDCPQVQPSTAERCPFLAGDLCSIYDARPFSCRCFASTLPCRGGAATLPESHLYGSMALMQLIEHLGQSAPWGNMTDMLVLLLQRPEYERLARFFDNPPLLQHARKSLRRARPLPGFAWPPEGKERYDTLLQRIFAAVIDGQTVEELLNGG